MGWYKISCNTKNQTVPQIEDRNIVSNKILFQIKFPSLTHVNNVYSNLVSKLPKRKTLFGKYLKERVSNSLFINPVKDTEIEKLIKNLNHNKSLGPSSILVKILKRFKTTSAFLINFSFQQGVFSESIKTARMTTISEKIIPKFLPITALYLCYQFLVSYMKNACTPDCIHF